MKSPASAWWWLFRTQTGGPVPIEVVLAGVDSDYVWSPTAKILYCYAPYPLKTSKKAEVLWPVFRICANMRNCQIDAVSMVV